MAFKDRPLLDEKLAFQTAFQYNGVKGGRTWKEAVEREIISKSPCLKNLMRWAEERDQHAISEELIFRAVGSKMTEDQILGVNASIWGFMAKALTGPAKTISRVPTTSTGSTPGAAW